MQHDYMMSWAAMVFRYTGAICGQIMSSVTTCVNFIDKNCDKKYSSATLFDDEDETMTT